MSDERKLKPVVATPQDDHATGGGGIVAAPGFAPPPDDHATIGEPRVMDDDHATTGHPLTQS
ncbi:hypothetical protein [Streptomyces sp. UNOC14_S4]|uniref:hypothetical protein n=1 Tax=Streptomyces sp. UNOC14_S4 TaxID=2872340 RepID=UPI001E4A8079|nr:hypothetical protein [Streptomyces sp. UNOC14_S4]MCC3770885.1 hypothetical protein [Streptomyces sp. UNOC14_S4]